MAISVAALAGRGRVGHSANESWHGQGTVELAAVLPVVLIIAAIAVNACTFFSECALFDREARQAVRVYATSYGYGEGSETAVARIAQALDSEFDRNNEDVSVTASEAGDGCLRYTATIAYLPTLFSLGLKSSILGVQLPALHHEVSLVVDPYDPGVSFG